MPSKYSQSCQHSIGIQLVTSPGLSHCDCIGKSNEARFSGSAGLRMPLNIQSNAHAELQQMCTICGLVQLWLFAAPLLLICLFADASMQCPFRLPSGNSQIALLKSPDRQHAFAHRQPVRITITVSCSTYDQLQQRSDREGRSLSNLASHLLECALCS